VLLSPEPEPPPCELILFINVQKILKFMTTLEALKTFRSAYELTFARTLIARTLIARTLILIARIHFRKHIKRASEPLLALKVKGNRNDAYLFLLSPPNILTDWVLCAIYMASLFTYACQPFNEFPFIAL
jgi:hypothetical protein